MKEQELIRKAMESSGSPRLDHVLQGMEQQLERELQNRLWMMTLPLLHDAKPLVFRPPPMFAPAALSEDENEPSVFGQATKGTPTMLHTITDADCDALIDDPLGFLNKKMSAGQSAIAEEMRTITEALRDKDFLDAMNTVTFATADEE